MYQLAVLILAIGAFNFAQSKECSKALGMESGAIADKQITASSQYDYENRAAKGRLGRPGSWSARGGDIHPWFQIDLESNMKKITRVATQGRPDLLQWVTKYKLQFSNDAKHFMTCKNQGTTEDMEFAGNKDENTVVSHDLNSPIRARYIRFLLLEKKEWFSMRAELYGCEEGFQCPVCHAIGGNAETECDHNPKYEICNRQNAVCQLTKTTTDRGLLDVRRKCSDKDTFTKEKEECAKDKKCLDTAYCTDPRCMANLPDAFQCAECSAAGWNAHCLGKVTYKICKKPKPACFVTQLVGSNSVRLFRGCGSHEEYQESKSVCRQSAANCPLIGRCSSSKCRAPFPVLCGQLQRTIPRLNILVRRQFLSLWSMMCV